MCPLCCGQDDRFISVGVFVVVVVVVVLVVLVLVLVCIMAVGSVVAYYLIFRQCPKRY